MSGHSKWATTKHKKAVVDARRGKLFAKLIKNIEVAARTGGGDLAGNPTLYDAIQKAKKTSVPNDNIDRAVKRGSGAEAGGADWQTIMYEGYGPSGVAVLIECLTDNRNRAASEVRVAMTRNGGSMADPGSVSYLFTRKGDRARLQRGPYRGRRARPRCSMQAPKRSTTSATPSRWSASPPTWSLSVRPCRTPASTTSPPRRPSCRASRYLSTSRARERCSGSSRPSRTPMTCRTSGRTSTCPTRSWRRSASFAGKTLGGALSATRRSGTHSVLS